MINPYGGPPTTTGPETTKPQQQSTSSGKSKTTFLNQNMLQQLMQMFSGMLGGAGGGYANFVNDPTSSSAFQNSLSGLLAALAPGEQNSRNALTDQFRASGGLRGSAYGQSASNLEGDIMRNQQITASDLLAKMYPQIASAMFAPMSQLANVMSASKGTTSTQESQSGPATPTNGGIEPSMWFMNPDTGTF